MTREAQGERDVIVVGAGVAGLVAANELAGAGHSVTVLESQREPGGRVRTGEWAGARVERGAVYFTPRYRELRRAIRTAGLEDRVMPLANAFRTAMRRDGRWHYVDFQRWHTIATYSGLGLVDKALLGTTQLASLPLLPRMRFGDLATVAPLDDRRRQFPPRTARDYFSAPIIEVFCGYRERDVTFALTALASWFPGKALTLDGGLGTLTAALAARVHVEYATTVTAVRAAGGGVEVDVDGEDEPRRAAAAVAATPADVTARLLDDAPEYVRSVRYGDMTLLFLRTSEPFGPADQRGRPLYMQLIPRPERRGVVDAIGFVNEAAPDGGLLVLNASPDARASLDDDELSERMLTEADELNPGLRRVVVDRTVVRHPRVVASFADRGAARAAEFRGQQRAGPLQLAGDYTHGPWMESAALSGRAAAERAAEHLQRVRPRVMSGAT